MQVQFTDSSSARQLLGRQGCGKIRHLSGKVLWVQENIKNRHALLIQIPTAWNTDDIGTKTLGFMTYRQLIRELRQPSTYDGSGKSQSGDV